jgi:hypothetical protein
VDSHFGSAEGPLITKLNSRFLVNAVGALLVCASLLFITLQAWSFRDQLMTWEPGLAALAGLPIGILVYALGCRFHAAAWKMILIGLERQERASEQLVTLFARSQLGKYIPGNVAHLAGRHLLSRQLGYSHGSLVLSTFYEFSGLISAAGTLSALALALIVSDKLPDEIHSLVFAVPVLVLTLPALHLTHRLMAKYSPGFKSYRLADSKISASVLIAAYGMYLLFFLLAGCSMMVVVTVVSDMPELQSWFLILLAFSVSWILGFVTPGAPSGIGVREAVLLYMLSPLIGASHAFIVSILFRVVTISGDLVFWLILESRVRWAKTAA